MTILVSLSFFTWAQSDTTITYPVKAHTASMRVKLLDSSFYMPQLNRSAQIWIYLPPGYESGRQRYPVMYMHDGQNIFDEYTAQAAEWGVDECIDSVISKGKPACIVIAI